MFFAVAILASALLPVTHSCQCMGFRSEVSGVESFDGRIVCQQFCPRDQPDNLLDFLGEKARDLRHLYSQSGFLEAKVEFESWPTPAAPVMKLRIEEGDVYRIQGFEIQSDRPDYDTEPLREELQVQVGDPCSSQLIDISAWRMRHRGKFKSFDVAIIKGPDPGQVYVRITLSDNSKQHEIDYRPH